MHERTKYRLHSHDVPYGSGSGQQSVTGFPNVDDANSYWVCKSTCLSVFGLFVLFCVF
jgi:dolichyl-phosphate-mannose--protein O-mannosyl transferase